MSFRGATASQRAHFPWRSLYFYKGTVHPKVECEFLPLLNRFEWIDALASVLPTGVLKASTPSLVQSWALSLAFSSLSCPRAQGLGISTLRCKAGFLLLHLTPWEHRFSPLQQPLKQ